MALLVPILVACNGAADDASFGSETWSTGDRIQQIGSVDDPDYAFQTVAALAMSPAGVLHSLHREEAAIRRWDPAGKPAGTIGRRGQGPGEFDTPYALGFIGDSLWVMDRRSYRVSYFDLAGTFLGAVTPRVDLSPDPANPDGSVPRPSLPLRDGTFYGTAPAWSEAIARGQLSEAKHVHMDGEGKTLATVWIQPYEPKDVLALLRDGGGTFSSQPFADSPLYDVSPDGILTVLDRRVSNNGVNGTFRLTRIDMSGDTLLASDVNYVPEPLLRQTVDSLSDARAESMYEFMRGMDPGLTLSKLKVDIRAATYSPDYLPSVRSMIMAEDGSIWLERSTTTQRGATWWVLNSDGKPLATAYTPEGFQVRLVTADAVWGIETDALDVNYIVAYELLKRGQ